MTSGAVTALGAGVAVGGDVVDSTISIGLQAHELSVVLEGIMRSAAERTEQEQLIISSLRIQLGVTEAALTAFFSILGEVAVEPEGLVPRLVQIAVRYKKLEKDISAVSGDDISVAALKGQAQTALEAGNLDQAYGILVQVLLVQDAAIDRRQLEAAATSAQLGQLALMRLRYVEAAGYFALAAKRVPTSHEEVRRGYLADEATAYYSHGDEFADNESLRIAIERRRALLAMLAPERGLSLWIDAQIDLGLALYLLGERLTSAEELLEAIRVYQVAL